MTHSRPDDPIPLSALPDALEELARDLEHEWLFGYSTRIRDLLARVERTLEVRREEE